MKWTINATSSLLICVSNDFFYINSSLHTWNTVAVFISSYFAQIWWITITQSKCLVLNVFLYNVFVHTVDVNLRNSAIWWLKSALTFFSRWSNSWHLQMVTKLCLRLSAGGGSLFAIHGDCEAYDTRTDRWHMVASMSTRRARVGVAAIGNRLYAVGGWVMGVDSKLVNPPAHLLLHDMKSAL